jgi:hypothetical protein
MRKLSIPQLTFITRISDEGGTWNIGPAIHSHSTRESLESLGLITSRRYVWRGRRVRIWTYSCTLTDAGRAYLDGTLTEYPGKPRTLVQTQWGNYLVKKS